jgi:hypothetical protein
MQPGLCHDASLSLWTSQMRFVALPSAPGCRGVWRSPSWLSKYGWRVGRLANRTRVELSSGCAAPFIGLRWRSKAAKRLRGAVKLPRCALLAPFLRPSCALLAPFLRPSCALLAPFLRPSCALLAPFCALLRPSAPFCALLRPSACVELSSSLRGLS